jgi:hypothetical protein
VKGGQGGKKPDDEAKIDGQGGKKQGVHLKNQLIESFFCISKIPFYL